MGKKRSSGSQAVIVLPEKAISPDTLRFRKDLAQLIAKRREIDTACGTIYGTKEAADLYFMSLYSLLCYATPEAYQEEFGASPENDLCEYTRLYNDALHTKRKGESEDGK